MKISTLIERLQEVQKQFGDLETVVGEANSVLRTRFHIEAQHHLTSENSTQMFCILQAYVIKGGFGNESN